MDQIMSDIIVGRLVGEEMIKKEAGGKICISCKSRYTDPNYRRVKYCDCCLYEHNTKEVHQMLGRLGI